MEKRKKMENKVFVLCVAVAVFLVAIAGIGVAAWATQLDDAYNELLDEYGNLSAEYNETSGELNETKDWLLEKEIYRYGTYGEDIGDAVIVGSFGKFIIENKTKVAISRGHSYDEESGTYTFIKAEIGFNMDKNNEIFMKVSTWDTASGTETEQWYCSGADCLNMTISTKQ